MTATGSAPSDRRDRSNLIAGAVVLILIAAAAAVGIIALRGGFGRNRGASYSVYLPGVPQLGSGAELLFQSEHVGEVMRTDPPRIGLQLLVTAVTVPEVTETIMLFPGDSVRLAALPETGLVTIALRALDAVTIQSSSGIYTLNRRATNLWLVDASGSQERLVVNGQAIGVRGRPGEVRTGDLIGIGRVRIEWQDLSDYSRVSLRIALAKLRKAAGVSDTTSPRFLLGSRSSIAMANAFGLGKPALRLEPSFGRAAFAMGPDSVIAAAPTVDLERTVQGMLSYLNSPAAVRREPATRFERVVSDLNRSLDQIAELGGRIETILARADAVSREQGGQGMVGRLVLDTVARRDLNSAVRQLSTVTASIADTSRSLLARLKLDTLEAGVTRAIATADVTLKRADSVLGKAGVVVDSLRPIVATVRDSLAPLLGNANGLFNQGNTVAKGLRVPLGAALISLVGLSVTGILKLIGVF